MKIGLEIFLQADFLCPVSCVLPHVLQEAVSCGVRSSILQRKKQCFAASKVAFRKP